MGGNKLHIILMGLKKDKNTETATYFPLRQELAKQFGGEYLESSSANGEGVRETLEKIISLSSLNAKFKSTIPTPQSLSRFQMP